MRDMGDPEVLAIARARFGRSVVDRLAAGEPGALQDTLAVEGFRIAAVTIGHEDGCDVPPGEVVGRVVLDAYVTTHGTDLPHTVALLLTPVQLASLLHLLVGARQALREDGAL